MNRQRRIDQFSRLRMTSDDLVRTTEGQPNLEFWQAIYYKPAESYGEVSVYYRSCPLPPPVVC